MIIEEAHHILLKRIGGQGGEAITDTILREIRELGEAIVLVDQHPSMISIPALGNTYTTIAMNLKHKSDVSAVGAAMLMDDEQRDILGRLPVGMAVVKMQGRWLQPFVIKIPFRSIQKGSVNDNALQQLMKNQMIVQPAIQKPESPPPAKKEPMPLNDKDKELLQSVLEHPFLGMVERYKMLGLSRRKGNALRESCLNKEWIRTVGIPTRSGKVVLLELTEMGKQALRERGHSIPTRPRWGSLEHEYWKRKTAEACRAAGYEAEEECSQNGFIDVVAKRGEESIAIEIETGKSNWRSNLQKNVKNGFRQIWILTTNDSACHAIAHALSDLSIQGEIHVERVQDFVTRKNPFEKGPISQ